MARPGREICPSEQIAAEPRVATFLRIAERLDRIAQSTLFERNFPSDLSRVRGRMTLQLLVEVAGNPRSLVVLAGLYQHPGGGVQSALARTEHRGLLARLDRPATIADGEIRFGEGHVLARRRIRIIALHIGGEAVAKHTNRIAMPG